MQNAQNAIDFCKTGEYYQYISFRKFRNSCFRRGAYEVREEKKKERIFIMRKFKKALSVALVTAMAFTSLTACSKSNNAGNGETTTPAPSSSASTDGETETTKTAAADRPTLADYGSGTIKIWVADKVVDFTQARCDEFFKANPDMAGYTVEIQAIGEGDAAGNMVTDVQADRKSVV